MFDYLENIADKLPDIVWNLLLILIALIFGFLLKWLIQKIMGWELAGDGSFSLRRSVRKRMSRPLSYFLPLLMFKSLLSFLRAGPKMFTSLDRTVDILLMVAFAGLLLGILKICEDYVFVHYDINKADNLRERKIRTQLQFIRRLAIILVILITLGFILMSFPSLRKLGTGLLTGVGVGGVIIGFAAQKSLSGFLAGFQIAFTQPIRIDDVLIVEGEWGRVEEITLTYVVMKLWDLRRLVIPINYFIEKPFQNWTRTESEILGTVFVYFDYTVPVDPLRGELTRLLQGCKLWNGKVNIVQVTNATEKTIEIRALMSANSSSDAFDLRCIVREGLIDFVRMHYPDALPLLRIDMKEAAVPAP